MPAQKPGPLKPVPGYSGLFVTLDGANVFSGRRKRGGPRRLKKYLDKDGYWRVSFGFEGRCLTRGVHRLVCLAFHGVPPGVGYEAQHVDGVRANNRPANLKWGTPKQNADDRNGHGHTVRGQSVANAKFSNLQVRAIKRQLARGTKQKDIAAQFGVCRGAISHIATGRNWASI